jgi:phosphate-selective porin OprO/OprP
MILSVQLTARARAACLGIVLCLSLVVPVRAQELESAALARRLATLEAEVALLRDAASPDAGWTLPVLVGEVEPVHNVFVPSSSSSLLESQLVQPALSPPPKQKHPSVQVNGVFQADMMYFGQDASSRANNGDLQDGAGFRRFRLSAAGAVAENVNYFGQLDFGFFGRPTFTDVWGEVTKVPLLGNVRFGQWKQPYSLEVVTSFRYQTFLERSLLFQTFDAFRHIGVGFYNNSDDEQWTWAMSVFRPGQDQFGDDIGDSGGAASAGRLTWLPYYEKEGDSLSYLHLGGAYYIGDPASNVVRYASIPEAFVGAFGLAPGSPVGTSRVVVPNVSNGTPPFIDTGNIPTHMFANIGTEVLLVEGPVSVQSEVQMSTISQRAGPQLTFWGFYLYGSYFLTGESRPYLRKSGALDRLVPLRPFLAEPGDCYGPGGWEMALRWSYIDLNNDNIRGGRLADVTAALNWYLNGYAKIQFNYIRAMQQKHLSPNSSTDIFGVRAQVDW